KAIDFRGWMNIQLKNYEAAIKDYEQYISVLPSKPQGYLSLARLYLGLKNEEKTEELCKKILNEIDKNNVEATLTLSLLKELQGNAEESLQIVVTALEKNQNDILLLNRISELYFRKGDLDNAMVYAQKALDLNSKATTARYVKGNVHFIRQEYEKAAIEFENFYNPPPNYGDVFYKLGICYLEMNKPQQGINELKKMIERYPQYSPAYFTLAFTYMREGWAEEAIKLCEQGLELSPNNIKGLEIMAKANIANKNFMQAEAAFEKLVALRPKNVADILSLASLLINRGELVRCQELCERVLEINPKNINAHSIIGFCNIQQGNIDQAIDKFKTVVEIDPLNINGHLNLAKMYSSVQRFHEAEQALLKVIDLKPNSEEAYKELGNLYFVQKKYDHAIDAYSKVLETAVSEDIASYIALASAYFAKEDYAKALSILGPFVYNPKYDDNTQLHSFLASLYMKENNIPEAEKHYKKVLDVNPRFRPAYDLGLVYTEQGKVEESIEIYKQALKLNPNLSDMLLYLSIAQQQNEEFDDAIDSLNKLIALQPQNNSLYFMKVNIYAAKGDFEKAQQALDELATINDELRNAYLEVLSYCKNNSFKGKKFTLLLNQMKIFRVRGWRDQALKLAQDASELYPDNILPLMFMADLYSSIPDYENAHKVFKQIIAVKPNSFFGITRLSRLYAAQQKYELSIETLNQAIEYYPQDGYLYLDLGVLHETAGQSEQAMKAYEKAVEVTPDSSRALNNLAWLYSENNINPDKAEEYAKRAAVIEPQNGAIADTYGWILFNQGKYEEAKIELERASKFLPSNPTVAFHLGKAYYQLSDMENARIILEKSLSISQDFPEAKEAQELYDKLPL
ncbi:tetratricopeptide repeat protein, partial [bacterium]|nr:tetratricopeptide repeat protein [bacterium]